MPNLTSLLHSLEEALIHATSESRHVHEVGNCLALLHPHEEMVFMNWAVPRGDLNSQDIKELVDFYKQNQRTPFFEFFRDLWPQAETALLEAGFSRQKEMPVMVLTKSAWRPREIRDVRMPTLGEAEALARLQADAFGMPPNEAGVDWVRRAIASGEGIAAHFHGDGPVGVGFRVGNGQIAEIAGIATHTNFRRQGIATRVIAALLNDFFGKKGEIAWLTPGDDGAESVYERLGFRTVGTAVALQL